MMTVADIARAVRRGAAISIMLVCVAILPAVPAQATSGHHWAHPDDSPSVDRDRDWGASSCKAGGITPAHLWAFEAEQRRSPTAIRMPATLAVSDRLPVHLFPWKYRPRSLYAVP